MTDKEDGGCREAATPNQYETAAAASADASAYVLDWSTIGAEVERLSQVFRQRCARPPRLDSQRWEHGTDDEKLPGICTLAKAAIILCQRNARESDQRRKHAALDIHSAFYGENPVRPEQGSDYFQVPAQCGYQPSVGYGHDWPYSTAWYEPGDAE